VVKSRTTGAVDEASEQPAVSPVPAIAYVTAPSESVTGVPAIVVPDCAVVSVVGVGVQDRVGMAREVTVNVSCVDPAE
jgi:hypothetical protein